MPVVKRTVMQAHATAGVPRHAATLWAHIHYETSHVHAKWMVYRQLFGTSAERFDLLMQAASWAFTLIEQALLDDVQLTLSKLVDESKGTAGLFAMKKALCRLPHYAEWVRTEFDPALRVLATACTELTRRRHEWIAHHARAAVEAEAIKPRMNPARQEIEDALTALRLVMNATHRRFGENQVAYEHVFLAEDGEALVEVVRRGLLLQKLSQDGVVPWQLLLDRAP